MTPTAVQEKDKLARIEAELAEQRDAAVEADRELESAKETFNGSDAPLSRDSEEYQAVKAAAGKVGEIDERIAELTEMQVATLEAFGKSSPRSSRGRKPGEPGPSLGGWDAEALLAGDDVREMLSQYANSATKMGRTPIGEVANREALAADVTGTTNMRRGEFGGIVPQLRRNLQVLDLIPTGTMDNNTFPYTQESGAFTGAAETAEGDPKPEAGITFTDAEAVARTIPAWLKLQKQSLEDVPALQAIVESRLRYLVQRRVEGQVLAGNGTAPNLRGILNTSGIGSVAFDGGAESTDLVLDGITTVLLADAQATGIVMNPIDWSAALKAKASGDGHYFSGGPFSVTPQVMWGVPLIASAAVAQGTALVGDFEIGAMLLIRTGLQVLLSDSDQDDFTKNKVTLLAEMRAALPVFRPAAFCVVEVDEPGS
jgi:HK97 family phage major capsid protein